MHWAVWPAVLLAGVWSLAVVLVEPVLWHLVYDDAFYYFEIARNVVAGHGLTFDRINPTNGFHVLWLLLCLPVYGLDPGPLAAVRVLLVLQLALTGAACVLLSLCTGRAILAEHRSAWSEQAAAWGAIVLACVFFSPVILKAYANGMESAVALLLHAVVLYMLTGLRGKVAQSEAGGPTAETGGRLATGLRAASSRVRWGLGGLLAMAFLARSDAGLLVAVLGLWCAGRLISRPKDLLWLLPVFAPPALAAGGFFALNLAWFGHPMQVSGELKRATLSLAGLGLAGAVAGVVLLAVHGLPGRMAAALPATAATLRGIGPYLVFSGLLVGYYSFLQGIAHWWYFGPPIACAAMLLAAALADLLLRARRESLAAQSAGKRSSSPLAVVFVVLVGIAGVSVWQGIEAASTASPARTFAANRAAAEWMNEHLPEGSVVGCWDAGVTGYFCRHRVVNLDGVVNSFAYLAAMRDGRAGDLLNAQGVAYITNHTPIRPDGSHRLLDSLGQLVGPQRAGQAVEIHRVPFVFTGLTNRGREGPNWAVLILHLPSSPPRPMPPGEHGPPSHAEPPSLPR
mgnify:CR=1 FL=1